MLSASEAKLFFLGARENSEAKKPLMSECHLKKVDRWGCGIPNWSFSQRFLFPRYSF
jgi:hypothetical protein